LEINANREEPANHDALSVSDADFRGDLDLCTIHHLLLTSISASMSFYYPFNSVKQVFPDVELLGWYATGALDAAVQDFHLKVRFEVAHHSIP
jgi:hypothetical protein